MATGTFLFSFKINSLKKRANPYKNTLTILEDPARQRKLFLVGTTNSSTLLAYRTKQLIETEKPDAVFLQTNKKWTELARYLKNVESQEELNNYNSLFRSAFEINYPNNPRGLIFKLRLYSWLLVAHVIKGNAFSPDKVFVLVSF